jgi:hypothetical protein
VKLERYWPQASQVDACIKNEAETADVAVLLAVHEPTPLIVRNVGTLLETPATEADLLSAFLTDHVPGGSLLLPITGPSGVGKSHMIRWLDAQLRRCPQRDKLHIIRIPKSASLRTVVELILAPLADDPRYSRARENLTTAVAAINLKTAVVTFRAELENVLSLKGVELTEQLRKTPERRELKPLIGHTRMLPRLFTDAALDKHFLDNVLSRIVARAVTGRHGNTPETDEAKLSQFVLDDLRIPESVDLGQAAQAVREHYVRNIAVNDERLQPAIDLLNSVVDAAIAKVFRLEENTGGPTLQDIILAVRENLMQDKTELVLLIEDFAALAGIQEVLLNVCIQEGEYAGRQVRATMRTAVAFTDGYLAYRDTILTRAQREWVIGGLPQSDDEIKRGVVNMVGSYLNAARWGDEELRRRFRPLQPEESLTDWLPVWRDDDLDDEGDVTLRAFGTDARGHPLFPYNRKALDFLAERHLRQASRLTFNPRRVINEILRNILFLRPTYAGRAFPPADFQQVSPNTFIANWLRQRHQPEAVSGRLGALLTVWGGAPGDETALGHCPPAVFEEFGLPTPGNLANIVYTPEPEQVAAGVGTTPAARVAMPVNDPVFDGWRAKLDAWAGGQELGQTDARDIRNALAVMVRDAMSAATLRIRDLDIKAANIYIPNARNNPPRGRIWVCEDHTDPTGTVRAGILGVVRHALLHGRSWNYPQADDDYVASAVLIDRLIVQFTPITVEEAITQAATLATGLITQARIAGFGPPLRGFEPRQVLEALLNPANREMVPSGEEAWDRVRDTALGLAGSRPARDGLQTQLLARVAAFQGTGAKPHALDIARIQDALSRTTADPPLEGLPDELKTFMRSISEQRLWPQLQSVVGKLRAFKTEVAEFLDVGFNKAQFVVDLQEIVRLLAATSTAPSAFRLQDYGPRITEFQMSPVVDLVKTADVIVAEADRAQTPRLLSALGGLDLGLIHRTLTFLTDTKTLLAAAERIVARAEADSGQVDPEVAASAIAQLLSRVAAMSPATLEATQ